MPIEGEPISWFSAFRAIFGDDLYASTKGHINSFANDEVERLMAGRFVIEERRYLYHTFGQLMDVALWGLAKIGPVRRALGTFGPYHGKSDPTRSRSILGRLTDTILRAANKAAWVESRLLQNVRPASAGVLLAVRARPRNAR